MDADRGGRRKFLIEENVRLGLLYNFGAAGRHSRIVEMKPFGGCSPRAVRPFLAQHYGALRFPGVCGEVPVVHAPTMVFNHRVALVCAGAPVVQRRGVLAKIQLIQGEIHRGLNLACALPPSCSVDVDDEDFRKSVQEGSLHSVHAGSRFDLVHVVAREHFVSCGLVQAVVERANNKSPTSSRGSGMTFFGDINGPLSQEGDLSLGYTFGSPLDPLLQ
mmetsp:Transcript_19692/g.57474  ORF Transcript_19692/g.57474 Transcript_19692/m.57474 type:complete len:218 (-) Transcript_19692:1147-1800(-)